MASREDIEQWFQAFDADGSGKIDANELRNVVRAYLEWQNGSATDGDVDSAVGVMDISFSL